MTGHGFRYGNEANDSIPLPRTPSPNPCRSYDARCSHYSALWAVADSFDDLQANPRPHPRSLLKHFKLTLFFFPMGNPVPTTKSPGKRLLSDIGSFIALLIDR